MVVAFHDGVASQVETHKSFLIWPVPSPYGIGTFVCIAALN